MAVEVLIFPCAARGDVYRVLRKFKVRYKDRQVTVPEGFESDGASIPRLFWRVITPADSRIIRAAFVHDYLYRKQPKNWTRQEADELFRLLCIRDGLNPALAWTLYYALRIFGGAAWRENSDQKLVK